ncbi:hypothetical protein Cni_G24622 [Canna indica]|uniref:Uncharacterized protein n=1 Tax=Canna indica TaxID=4628 RepID=A0AAQ3QNM5_9LILI|nr:hypothetical protein Cni_G24622 [Canna indica]
MESIAFQILKTCKAPPPPPQHSEKKKHCAMGCFPVKENHRMIFFNQNIQKSSFTDGHGNIHSVKCFTSLEFSSYLLIYFTSHVTIFYLADVYPVPCCSCMILLESLDSPLHGH